MRRTAALAIESHNETIRLRKLAKQIPTAVNAALDGRTTEQAYRHVARALKARTTFVEAHYNDWLNDKPARERDARNREIMRLARAGQTNAKIAARFRLHPKSVQRLISAGRRAGDYSLFGN